MSAVATAVRARAGLLSISLAALLWGTTGVVVRQLATSTSLSPLTIGFYRLAVAAVVLLPVLIRAGRAGLRKAWARPWTLLVVGAGLGFYQALYFVGVTNVGVSVSTLVSLGIAPVAIVFAQAIVRRELPHVTTMAVVGCAVVGLALISLTTGGNAASAPHPVLGILASVGSGLGYAATTVLSRGLSHRIAPLELTAYSCLIGGVVLLPFALVFGIGFHVAVVPVMQLLYIGIGATAVAYGLFYAGLRTTPGEVASVLTLIEPLTAALLAVIILSEPLSGGGIAGTLLLLGAVAVLYLRPVSE